MKRSLSCLTTAIALSLAAPLLADELPTPADVFGHEIGADRKLVPYPRVLEYLETIAAASDRVSIEKAGDSTLGNPMPIVVLTSPENQERLRVLQGIGQRLADPGEISEADVDLLVDRGAAVALVTCTIHATEVGCTQMAMEFVHEFATTEDPTRIAWMQEAVLLLMPSINPDGQVMVVDWYDEWVGTKYEGGRMPWLYQTYVGHDNNRDFYMLTQKETRVVNDVLYHRWFPQAFLDEHQMGSTGPRMFVPPQTDPLAPEVHSLIFRQADLLGTNMGRRLEEAGKRGVGNNMIFDSYWPGGTRNTAWWKNVTGLLTEVASARIATPIYVDPIELRGGFKGLPEYVRRANYPSPWGGGWWRLRDIIDYERIATWAFLETLAENREEILRNMYVMARASIEAGRDGPPYAFVIPRRQHDMVASAQLVDLLLEHGVRVMRAAGQIRAGHSAYPKGTIVITADQPYRPFLLTMLRPQRFPEVRPYVDGPLIAPYDVTSWSLPISMGVDVFELDVPVRGPLEPVEEAAWSRATIKSDARGHIVPHSADTVYTLMNRLLRDGHPVYWVRDDGGPGKRGDIWLPADEVPVSALAQLGHGLHVPVSPSTREPTATPWSVTPQRVGLFKPWVASMDEGWTRWLLERYEFPFVNLSNEQIRSGEFESEIDVLLFPDVSKGIIAAGRPEDSDGQRRFWTPLPPPYAGGIDDWPDDTDGKKRKKKDGATKGGKRIKTWVEEGGTLVALDSSTEYVIDLLELPVRNVLSEIGSPRFDCPGSMLRIHVDTDHPLAFGMRPEEAAYFARSPAFQTRVPDARFDRSVVARYPDDDKDVLVSGYIAGADLLEKRAAVVELRVGAGRVVLIGFRAQHRAQPHRTFKLLFNAFYRLSVAGEEDPESP